MERQNDSWSINHTQYFNTEPNHLPVSTVKIEEEYKNHGNLSITIDAANNICTTTTEIKSEPASGDSEDDNDSSDAVIGQFVANTIIKEEIIIEPDVELFEVGFEWYF